MGLPEVDMGLQAKLGSIVVHVEEGLSASGHAFDWTAIQSLVDDPDVQGWLGQLRRLALLPEKRQ